MSSRHVTFDFSLVENGKTRQPSDKESDTLSGLFPGTFSVGEAYGFLVIRVHNLPPRPWPLTAAGLPLYITTDPSGFPWIRGDMGRAPGVLAHLNARDGVTDSIFDAVLDFLDTKTGVRASCVVYVNGGWRITVPDETDISNLPLAMCRRGCFYVSDSQINIPPLAAFRLKEPSPVQRDDSAYDVLKPGVMLSCGHFPGDKESLVPPRAELLTSSGIRVRDATGNYFVTVAGHGFPLGEERVYHPTSAHLPSIGQVVSRLGGTDIALMKLDDGFSFVNETFDVKEVAKVPISRIMNEKTRFGDIVSMNNPFTGYIVGSMLYEARQRIPTDEEKHPHLWARCNFLWLGEDCPDYAEGSCGSPILNEDHEVVAFFRFVVREGTERGVAVAVSAKELLNFGFNV